MELKWTTIDIATATKEEILAEMERMKIEMNRYMNAEQAIKIFINSVYGACGSPWFAFFNTDVAEAVTLQGQDLIKYSEKVINRYFMEFWHKDAKLHQKMNLTRVDKTERPVVVYCDTDSVAADTIIYTDEGEMTIEDLYKISRKIEDENITLSGKEWVHSSFKVLNEKNTELVFSDIRKIIRHKVNKPKWKLKTKNGKEVIVTGDHSLIVLREGIQVEVKPSEVKKGEKVICVRMKNYEIEIEEIESCEMIGTFDDEYVYDIEVDDEESHTFFANQILVHNSNFVCFKEILDKCDWKGVEYMVKNPKTGEDEIVKRPAGGKGFILAIYDLFLEGYLNRCYEIYSKNCGTPNYQSFELEKISDAGIWLAKKKYVYNTVWKDPGIDVEPLSDITAKGVEIVQSSSSKYVRDVLKSLLKHIFTKKKEFSVAEFASILKRYKDEFKLKNIEDIAPSSSIGDYEKHVLMDKDKLVLEKACPIHVRAAAIYNHSLFNSKYKKRYQPIRTGEKVKYYHVKGAKDENSTVFAFISGSFPIEFAPPIDYDVQFAKSIVQPINRFVEAMGYNPVSSQLVVSTQLF